jgi:WD40 repeat protein
MTSLISDFSFSFSGLDEGRIVIWTPLAEEKARILSQHSNCVDSLSFSPDGRFLASEDEHGKLIIWATEVTERIKRKLYLIVIQLIYLTFFFFFQNWEPVYIDEEERWGEHFSWLSSSTDVPAYKLTSNSYHGKVQKRYYSFFKKAHYNNHAPTIQTMYLQFILML